MKYLLKIAFIGTAYSGFQAQDNAPSIQRILTGAAEKVFGCGCLVTGCSRTDAGVHALGYCATVEPLGHVPSIRTENIPRAMCSVLPEDIGVLSASEVPDSFHPRYSAKGKEYIYLIYTPAERNPFYAGRAWMRRMRAAEAVPPMRSAAAALCGTNDYRSFMAAGSSVTDTVRTVSSFSVEENEGIIKLTVCADGFLYNMVRIMAGTLAEVGDGRISPESVADIIAARDRSAAGMTAPACGLYLSRVFY